MISKLQPALHGGLIIYLVLSSLLLTSGRAEMFQSPVDSPNSISNGYATLNAIGNNKYHTGIDLTSSTGSLVVRAAAAGTARVIPNGTYANDNHGLGNVVIIDHYNGKGPFTLYGHLASFSVLNGAYVAKGQQIGVMGNTGTTGVHLHFELKHRGVMGNLHDDLGPVWGYATDHPNLYGYINPHPYLDYALNVTAPMAVTVSQDQIVRTGPDAALYTKTVTSVTAGQKFVAFANYNGWYQIYLASTNGPGTGWIQATPDPSAQLLEINDPVPGIVGVNIRETASTAAAQVCSVWNRQWFVKSNQSASGNGCGDAWYLLYLGTNSTSSLGWVCGSYTSIFTSTVVTYSLTDLGDLPGWLDDSWAYAINAKAQIVGLGHTAAGYRAFLWTPGVGMQDLGVLIGGDFSVAYGINDGGQVVGMSRIAGADHAFLWTVDHGMQDLGGTPHPDYPTAAFDINASGQVVGHDHSIAVLWTADGGIQDLGADFFSTAEGINVNGQVVGGTDAFLWTEGGGLQHLGFLPGGDWSTALDINASGQVVGWSNFEGADSSEVHAFLWISGVGMQDLGVAPGMAESAALAINASGQVVGAGRVLGGDPTGYHGFLWTPGVGMQDLNSLVDESGVGWTLEEATDINDSGQITGTGFHNGLWHGFLLTPNPVMKPPISSDPSRLNIPELPPATPGKSGLIFITHGWNSNKDAWAVDLARAIAGEIDPGYLEAIPGVLFTAGDWDIVAHDWRTWAEGKPEGAALKALVIGRKLGEGLVASQYDKLHLIAHSAGSWMIDAIADKLQGSGKTVHITFLDAYEPEISSLGTLGDSATFAEHYLDGRGELSDYLGTGGSAGKLLASAYNVEVTRLDPNFGSLNPLLNNPLAWHAWPYRWYSETVDPAYPQAYGWGGSRSQELGTLPSHNDFPRDDKLTLNPPLPPSEPLYVTTPAVINQSGANLNFSSLQLELSVTGTKSIIGTSFQMITESPVWVSALVPVTGLVNYVTFKADFTSDPGAEGLLAVYWDGNLIGQVDERYVADGFQEYMFPFPGIYNANSYTLAFRMDRFTTTQSQVTIKDVTTGLVEAKYPPVTSFAATPTNGVVPLLVAFTNTTSTISGAFTNLFWDFGDGQTTNTTESSVTHLYGTTGTWTVALTVSGTFGSSAVTKPTYIVITNSLPPVVPIADFAPSTAVTGQAPFLVNFTDASSGTIASRLWTFGDGGTSGSVNPSHTYSNAGVFSVSLTVFGPGGTNTLNRSSLVAITNGPPAAPVASFTPSTAVTGQAPFLVNFVDTSSGTITNRLWTFGDGGTSNTNNPSHSYTNSGTFSVSLTVFGPSGSNTLALSGLVTVTNAPALDVTPPSVPMSVIATASNCTTVLVTWSASTDTGGSELAGYRLYRGGMEIGTATTTNYMDMGRSPGTEHCYTVAAYDNATNTSAQSSPATCVTTPDCGPCDLAEALDQFALSWSNVLWECQAAETQDGIDAAISGEIGDDQTSWFQTTVTGPGTLKFWWKVSSETNFDQLTFSIDHVEQSDISGEADWEQKTYLISSNQHIVTWAYTKNETGSEGFDAGFVDKVEWTDSPPSPLKVPSASVKSKCKKGICSVNAKFLLLNPSLQTSGPTVLGFYLSDDTAYDSGDVLLSQDLVSDLPPGKKWKKKLKSPLPAGVVATGKYILLVVGDVESRLVIAVSGPLP